METVALTAESPMPVVSSPSSPPVQRFAPPSPRSGYRLPIRPRRPNGARSPWATLEAAIRRVEKAKGIILADEFVKKALRNPHVFIALGKKLWPDRTFTEGDRVPTQIVFIDRMPDPPGPHILPGTDAPVVVTMLAEPVAPGPDADDD